MIDGDRYVQAVNRLRGMFFAALTKEFDFLLAKHTIPVEEGEEEEFITAEMEKLLHSMGQIADLFCKNFCEDPADLLKGLKPLVEEGN